MKLNHIHLPVRDLDRAVAFYRDSMGWPVGYSSDSMAEVGDDVVLDLTEEPIPPGVIVGIIVEDVDAAYAELTARGVAVDEAPMDRPWGVRNFYVSDPDGHQIEVEGPPAAT